MADPLASFSWLTSNPKLSTMSAESILHSPPPVTKDHSITNLATSWPQVPQFSYKLQRGDTFPLWESHKPNTSTSALLTGPYLLCPIHLTHTSLEWFPSQCLWIGDYQHKVSCTHALTPHTSTKPAHASTKLILPLPYPMSLTVFNASCVLPWNSFEIIFHATWREVCITTYMYI